jgi:hypothetical protein
MRAIVGGFIMLLSACGEASTSTTHQSTSHQSPEGAISADGFETARDGAGSLITGTAADWSTASEEAKNVYAMGSADALLAGDGSAQERASLAAAFRRCMDAEVARATPSALLGDVSYACALAFQDGAERF